MTLSERHPHHALFRVGLVAVLCWAVCVVPAGHAEPTDRDTTPEPPTVAGSPGSLGDLRRTAEAGDRNAQYRLGLVYERGDGDFPSEAEAIRWFRLAAEQGHPEAQFNLAVRYDKGRGVPRHSGEAVRWYRRAAEQGHTNARLNLGVRFAQGRGVARDYASAARWFRLGALAGDARAQFNLGLLHEKGWGVPANATHALAWYQTSMRQGHDAAADGRARLLDKLSAIQVAEAERLAKSWGRHRERPTDERCCPCETVCSLIQERTGD